MHGKPEPFINPPLGEWASPMPFQTLEELNPWVCRHLVI